MQGVQSLCLRQIWSIHVAVRTRTAKECAKMQNARASEVFRMKIIISLRGDFSILFNKEIYGTSWENERFDRANERVRAKPEHKK